MRTNVTIGSFVPGNETSTLSFSGTKRPLCGRFVPGNESAWERNVPVPMNVDEVRFQLPIVQEALTEAEILLQFLSEESRQSNARQSQT